MPGKTTLNIFDNSLQQMLNLNAVILLRRQELVSRRYGEHTIHTVIKSFFGVCSWTLLSL